MLVLNKLEKTTARRKRVGRGGKLGGTSGKGHKGQKARSGPNIRPLFEGGQTPLFRRLPKRGFSNARFAHIYEIVNIGDLERLFAVGEAVTRETLLEKGLIRGTRGASIKVLGEGELHKALIVTAEAFSATALAAIERQKGEARIVTKES